MIDKKNISAVLMLAVGALGGYFLVTSEVVNLTSNTGKPESIDQALDKQAFKRVEQFIWDLDGVHPDKIELKSADDVDWLNSCLGLPQYQEMCAKVIVPGWKITLDADGKLMVFRANKTGTSIRRDLEAEKLLQKP